MDASTGRCSTGISGLDEVLHGGLVPQRAYLVRAALEHAAEAKSIELNATASPDLPPVHADRDRLLQVFSNLIGNALKFTPEGGRVRVSAELVGDLVRFSVADSGEGISRDDLAHVFDRFWQARRSRQGGAGLGLAISRGIVTAHGGEIWMESEAGQGTTFVFTLPTAEAAAAPGQPG